MLIVRSACSCASACGGDKARETRRSAVTVDDGGWHALDGEFAGLNASGFDSASLSKWRPADLPDMVKSATFRVPGGNC